MELKNSKSCVSLSCTFTVESEKSGMDIENLRLPTVFMYFHLYHLGCGRFLLYPPFFFLAFFFLLSFSFYLEDFLLLLLLKSSLFRVSFLPLTMS